MKKKQMVVKRYLGSATSGCEGSAVYYPFYDKEIAGQSGIDPEDILGEELGTGSIIEISVRVVHREPMAGYCENPWPAHADGCAEADSKRRLGG
jgi:hypothetical protein